MMEYGITGSDFDAMRMVATCFPFHPAHIRLARNSCWDPGRWIGFRCRTGTIGLTIDMKTAMILGAVVMGHPRGLSHACTIPVLNLTGGFVAVGASFPLAIYLFVSSLMRRRSDSMEARMLDTLRASHSLRDSGLTEKEAEAVIAVIQEATALDLTHLATKDDLKVVEANLSRTILESKADTLKWVFSMILASTTINVGAIIALVKLPEH
jgi:hypothetical protein